MEQSVDSDSNSDDNDDLPGSISRGIPIPGNDDDDSGNESDEDSLFSAVSSEDEIEGSPSKEKRAKIRKKIDHESPRAPTLWDENWDEKFQQLKLYKGRHGHCNVRFRESSLGVWVSTQRNTYKNNTITEEKKEKLTKIGFNWCVRDVESQWEEKFQELKRYKETNGHCNVSRQVENILGGWVATQRAALVHNTMTKERKQRLDALGFEWKLKRGPQTSNAQTSNGSMMSKKTKVPPVKRKHRINGRGSSRRSTSNNSKRKTSIRGKRSTIMDSSESEDDEEEEPPPTTSTRRGRQRKVINYADSQFSEDDFDESDRNDNSDDDDEDDDNNREKPKRKKNGKGSINDYFTKKSTKPKPKTKTKKKVKVSNNSDDDSEFDDAAFDDEDDESLDDLSLEEENLKNSRKTYVYLSSEEEDLVLTNTKKRKRSSGGTKKSTLGGWVYTQRKAFKNDKMKEEKIKRLQSIGFIFESRSNLKEKSNENLNCDSESCDEFPVEGNSNSISNDNNNQNSIMSRHDKLWNEKFNELLCYKRNHGNCNVPQSQGSLGQWVNTQRKRFKNNKMKEERIKRLQSIGFIFYCKSNMIKKINMNLNSDSNSCDELSVEDKNNKNVENPCTQPIVVDKNNGDPFFKAKARKGRRQVGKEIQYLIEWCNTSETTWEPRGNLCDSLLADAERLNKISRKTLSKIAGSGENKIRKKASRTKHKCKNALTGNESLPKISDLASKAISISKKTIKTPKLQNAPIEVWSGPPNEKLEGGWPDGWIQKIFERRSGKTKGSKDRYWYSPKTNRKFRSMTEIKRYMTCLRESNGDEDAAWLKFKSKLGTKSALVARDSSTASAATDELKMLRKENAYNSDIEVDDVQYINTAHSTPPHTKKRKKSGTCLIS